MKSLKKIFLFTCSFVILGLLVVVGLSEFIRYKTSSQIYFHIDSLPDSHTVIILGASVYSDGKLSPILQDRVDTALMLYQKGKATRFLLSGDHRQDDYNEVSAMRNYLLHHNVPIENIYTDPAGLDTYDSMHRSGSVYEVPNAVVVTQQFHLPRTLFIANNLGYNYLGFPAESRKYIANSTIVGREKFANLKAVYEIFTKHTPASTEKIPVTGKPQRLKE